MNMLKEILANQIPVFQKRIKDLIAQKGESEISRVNVAQAYSGLRGIKAFVCDTSAVVPDKGLIIRGKPLLDIKHILPEEVFYLLIAGRLPTEAELTDLKGEFSMHLEVPQYVWDRLEKFPEDSHPMTMFSSGILAMQRDSLFRKKYDEGMPKTS